MTKRFNVVAWWLVGLVLIANAVMLVKVLA